MIRISNPLVISFNVCLSILPHGTTWLSLDTYSQNLIFEYFTKICQENSSFMKI